MSEKRSNKKFTIGIAVAVLVPLSCFLVVKRLSENKVFVPRYYGVDSVLQKNSKQDTVFHKTGDLVLTNQLGQRVSLNNDLRGKILVVDFFFTTCPSICPKMSTSMALLQKGFKKDNKKEESLEDSVQFISITIDPGHDSFPALRAYADRYGANPDHWWFLTGDKKTIYAFARNELHLPVGPGDGGADDFIHSDKVTLLDQYRYIRGYYSGLNDTDMRKCADDIVLLTLERKHKQ